METATLGMYHAVMLMETMPQSLELRDAEDDWTGVTSTAKRRKLQNRLNQRARSKWIQSIPTTAHELFALASLST